MFKKILLLSVLIVINTNVMAWGEQRTKSYATYFGVNANSFGILSTDIYAENLTTGARTTTTTGAASDNGSSASLFGGIVLSKNSRFHISYLSGKENTSSIYDVTTTGLSYDYRFGNKRKNHGFYLGAGISKVDISSERNATLEASTTESKVGPLLRLGYEFTVKKKFLFLVGLDAHLAEIKYKAKYVSDNNQEFNATTRVMNISVGASYIFK